MVDVVRRYSRQPHLLRLMKRGEQILGSQDTRPDAADAPVRPKVRKLSQRLSPETVEALARDYASGLNLSELQAKYDLSKGSVRRLLGEAGVPMRRQSLPVEQVHELAKLYQDGLTMREIAAQTGVPKTTIQNVLQSAGVVMRPAHRRDSSNRTRRIGLAKQTNGGTIGAAPSADNWTATP